MTRTTPQPGYDGVSSDHYLAGADGFDLASALTAGAEAEGILEVRWWDLDELDVPVDGVVFGPRRMADLLRELDDPTTDSALARPRQIGL